MDKPKPVIGGQAVLEGVMMRSPKHMAVAVRKGDASIPVKLSPVVQPAEKHPFLGWPIVRGVVSFAQSLVIGTKTLTDSAQMLDLEPEEPSRFEKAVAKATGKKADDVMMACAILLAVALAIGLFIFLPSLAVSAMRRVIENRLLVNFLEGVLRLAIFLGYMLAVSLVPDIRRTFAYHGAEHKVVMTFEQDGELTVERCMRSSRFHPRCGTSFLLIVMLISILCFSLLPIDVGVFARAGMRLALMPIVAGISYEALRGFARRENALTRALRAPGLWTQRITTREPDAQMVEVALKAFQAALTGEVPPGKPAPVSIEEADGGVRDEQELQGPLGA